MRRTTACLLLFLSAACGRTADPIRVGIAGPLSEVVGRPMQLAAELAVEEINAAGGVRGRPLELVIRDDRGDLDSAVAAAAALINQGVVAVVGHIYSGTTLAVAPIYGNERNPVPLIATSSSSPEILNAGAHVFRLCPTDLEHAAALAHWIRRDLGLSRGAVLYLNTSYGRGMRQTFNARFRGIGGEVIASDPYLGSTPDVGPHLDRMVAADSAEFLMIAGYREDASAILHEARARGLDLPVFGGDGLEGIEAAGSVAEGVAMTTAYLWSIASPANRAFLAAWRERYPDAPPPNQPGASAYDAIHLLAEAMRVGGISRRAILTTLPRFGEDLPARRGVTGTLAWDGAGDLSRAPVRIVTIRDGATVLLEPN